MPVPGKKQPRPSATFFSRQYSSFKSVSSMQESLGNWITNIVLANEKINKFKNKQDCDSIGGLQAGPKRISGLGVISNFSIRRSRILIKLEIDLSQIFFGGRPATPRY